MSVVGVGGGFLENEFVGHQIRIGSKVVISVLERDPRCQMITRDPNTASPNTDVLPNVARRHGRCVWRRASRGNDSSGRFRRSS
jgi:hypothetical protein